MKIVELGYIFMLLFAFPITRKINSVKLLIIIFGVTIFINKKAIPKLIREIKKFKIEKIIFLYIVLILLTLIFTIGNNQYDFSLLKKIISSMIYIIFILFFYSYLKIKKVNIPNYIVYSFVIQSFLILLSISFDEVYNILSIFREELSENHLKSYGKLRGNAVSGYQFFGISTMFGFTIIYFLEKNRLNNIFKIGIVILLTIVGILSGRYFIVALFLGIAIKIFKNFSFKRFFLLTISIILSLVISIKSIYIVDNLITNNKTRQVYKSYILKPVEGYLENKKLESSSTNALFKMYEKNEEDIKKSFWLGQGRYLMANGKYFMEVDPGFLRIIFYYGILGIVILFGTTLYIIFFLKKSSSKNNILLKVFFALYILLLNYKGDVFLYSNNILPVIIGLIYFQKED